MRVRSYAQFTDEWLGKVPLADLERASLLFDVGEVHRARYGRVKRLLDIAFALVGMVVFVLLVPFVVLGDLVANRGPLIFGQERVGQGRRARSASSSSAPWSRATPRWATPPRSVTRG